MPGEEKPIPVTVRLSQLTASLSRHIACWEAGESVWLSAEVVRCRVHSSGHCYLTLVEKAGPHILARVEAVLWANDRPLLEQFAQVAGEPLSPGNQVRVLAQVRFHPAYGLTLTLQDIQPLYPIGALEQQRRAALLRLQEEGLTDCNKARLLSAVPHRVLILSSETAAGYADFLSTLRHNPLGYVFTTRLVPATLQGRGAVASLRMALQQAERCAGAFDVLVVLRGGGAPEDLSPFNDYALAAALARFPLPVLTGIGHERDETLADVVAHTALATPTSAAEFLLGRVQAWEEAVLRLQGRLETSVQKTLQSQQSRLNQQAVQTTRASERGLRRQEGVVQAAAAHLRGQGSLRLARQEHRLGVQAVRVASLSNARMRQQQAVLGYLCNTLSPCGRQSLQRASSHLEGMRGILRGHHPRQRLQQGYCLVRQEGRLLLSPAEVRVGEVVEIETRHGRFLVRVEWTQEKAHGATEDALPAGAGASGTDCAAAE